MLNRADLGPGWAVDEAGDDQARTILDAFKACMGPEVFGDGVDHVDSPIFTRGQVARVGSFSAVFDERQAAREAFQALSGDKTERCLREAVRRVAENEPNSAITFNDLRATKARAPALGDEASATDTVVVGDAGGVKLEVHLDLLFVRRERAVAGVFGIDFPQSFPRPELEALARRVAARMAG